MGAAAAMLLPLAEKTKHFRTGFGKIITHISLVSYSMYLINLCLVADVIRKNFESQVEHYPLLMYAFFWIAVIGISTLLYKFFEKPVMDLREKKNRNPEYAAKENIPA